MGFVNADDKDFSANISHDALKDMITDNLQATSDARDVMRGCRAFYDGKQLTAEERAILRARKQTPVIINRIKFKTNGFKGLVLRRNKDPQAFPRTPKHEQAATAVTDGLRYVSQNNRYHGKRADAAESLYIEGITGFYIPIRAGKSDEPEIQISALSPQDIIYDHCSEENDFSDARYKGFKRWIDADRAAKIYPNAKFGDLDKEDDFSPEEGAEKRLFWFDKDRKRVLLAHIFFKNDDDIWHEAILHSRDYVMPPRVSPYVGCDDGKPICPVELAFAYQDDEKDKYGEVFALKDLQREINARKSKAMHYNSARQTWGRKGSLGKTSAEVRKKKEESAKPDGHLEIEGSVELGKDFGFIDTDGKQKEQFLYYQDAKQELDAVSFNAQLSGQRSEGNLSGRAIRSLQEAGTLELEPILHTLDELDIRVYTQIWSRIKQFWTREKWVRVTDDDKNVRFVGFNAPIPAGEWLKEQAEDESNDPLRRQSAAASLRYLEQTDPEALRQIVDVKNPTAELDVDIILDDEPASINSQEEQFAKIIEFSKATGGEEIDLIDLIRMSTLRNKKQLIESIEKRRAAGAEELAQGKRMQLDEMQSNIAKSVAEATQTQQKAQQTALENALLIRNPDEKVQVIT